MRKMADIRVGVSAFFHVWQTGSVKKLPDWGKNTLPTVKVRLRAAKHLPKGLGMLSFLKSSR